MYYIHSCWPFNLFSHLPCLYSKIALPKESIYRNAHFGPGLLGIHLCFDSAWTQLSLTAFGFASFPRQPCPVLSWGRTDVPNLTPGNLILNSSLYTYSHMHILYWSIYSSLCSQSKKFLNFCGLNQQIPISSL